MLTTKIEMDEDVQQILVEGLLPSHLKLLTVEKLKQISLHFGIAYTPKETVPKEEFIEKLDEALTRGGHYATIARPSKPSPQSKETELRLEIEQMKLKKEVLELELRIKQEAPQSPSPKATINTNVLPQFDDKDPEAFFKQFEKIAFHWDRALWPVLVQKDFKGKAREAFASLSVADSQDYEKVKEAVLLAYELSAEAYRQQFRSSQMDAKESHVEFAHTKKKEFEKWIAAAKIEDMDGLQDAILAEEFLGKIALETRQYLADKGSVSVMHLAQLADKFVLAKKLGQKGTSKGGSFSKPQDKKSPPNNSAQPRKCCSKCGKYGDEHDKCPEYMSKISCSKCHNKGHYSNVCTSKKPVGAFSKKKGKQKPGETSDQTEKPMGFVKTRSKQEACFSQHLYNGHVSVSRHSTCRRVVLLRDTGAAQSLVLKNALNGINWKPTGEHVICIGLGGQRISVPLVRVHLRSQLFKGWCRLGIVDSLPVESAQVLLGNDVIHGCTPSAPVLCNQVVFPANYSFPDSELFPSCAVTRSQAKEVSRNREPDKVLSRLMPEVSVDFDKATLSESQVNDPSLNNCFAMFRGEAKCPLNVEYFLQNGVLVRRWSALNASSDHIKGEVINQVVLPKHYRSQVLETAHSVPMSGHLGIRATYQKILLHFFWPGLHKDVAAFCKACLECQVVGKANQKIPLAPLHPVPAVGDPFSDIQIDFVGPLPRTKTGKQYLLTVMCKTTRYPEAFPLSSTRSCHVISCLTSFFCSVGTPRTVQSDNGSSFVSSEFKTFLEKWGVKQVLSTPYRPQSQGALERYHQTLKRMLSKFCLDNTQYWDRFVPLLLFCTRDTVQESLGFSPFQLLFGHKVRGPLSVLKAKCLEEGETQNLLEYVDEFTQRLQRCRQLARENLESAQKKMKKWYNQKSVRRSFSPGDMCLVFLPISKGALSARYFGPYRVLEKVSDLTYRIATPDRGRKQRTCHLNQMKEFQGPYVNDADRPVGAVQSEVVNDASQEIVVPRLSNSAIMSDLSSYLAGVPDDDRVKVKELLLSFSDVFSDKLGRTDVLLHDVELLEDTPVRLRPYRTSPAKSKIIREEVDFLVREGLATPATHGEWASPCILVPKPDGSSRLCIDYRLCNKQIKPDAYPMPRLLDCIDQIGEAHFISKLDLLKGYWQVPLSPRAREVYSFVTSDGLFHFNVLPFGCKNAPACFQRLMNQVVQGIRGVACYLDDIIVFSDSLSEHLEQLERLLQALRSAKLVVNLAKSEFMQSSVEYLGHVVGHGQVKPKQANVKSILDMEAPSDIRSLRRFLGAAGFYRRFCKNFSTVCLPLTTLLKKHVKYQWTADCQKAFDDVKAMLSLSPILKAPDFSRPFVVYTDASGQGIGGVLMQKDRQNIEHPVAYFSRKLDKHQLNYSPIEKECLAIVLTLTHFAVYLNNGHTTLVYTDHNPLAFLSKMKDKNQKLLRWSLLLQEFDICIKHVRGVDNVIADMLSRS